MIPAVLLTACLAAQPTFHVAPDGNDTWSGKLPRPNAGRTDGPFATPARARDAVRQLRARERPTKPITVLLRGGRYELAEPLTFTPADSGTAASPTRFAAYPGEQPVLSGGRRITGWKEGKGGVWTASLPGKESWAFRHLSVNGRMRHRPRLPATGTYQITGLAGADPKAKYNTPASKFEFAPGQLRASWKNLTDVEAVVLHFWVDTHLRVAAVDEKACIVTFDRSSRRRFTETHAPTPARFYLTNVFEALSRPGEFYLDSATRTVHYIPERGEALSKAEVVAPRLDAVLVLAGKPDAGQLVEHLHFAGLTFSDTTWQPPARDAVDAQAASIVPGSVRLHGARHCALTGCKLVNLTGYGIELTDGCRHNRVVGNELTHLSAGGIRVTGGAHGSPKARRTGQNEITDNHLHRLGEHFHSGVGVLVQHADRNTIAHNHIHHLYYTGISVGWVWGYAPSVSRGNRIEHNRIHDVGQGLLSDMGGIYLLGVSPDTVVRGNVIHDVDAFHYGGWGIYTDEGSSGILIENNLVYRTKNGGFHQHYGRENVVRNNIFALARTVQVARTRMEKHTSFTFERNIVYYRQGQLLGGNWKDDRFALDRNLYYQADGKPVTFPDGLSFAKWQARGFDKHSKVADPRFKDPEKGDFTLAADSPALGLGFKPFDTSRAGPRK
jgi:parallel beta-helix repeat protein